MKRRVIGMLLLLLMAVQCTPREPRSQFYQVGEERNALTDSLRIDARLNDSTVSLTTLKDLKLWSFQSGQGAGPIFAHLYLKNISSRPLLIRWYDLMAFPSRGNRSDSIRFMSRSGSPARGSIVEISGGYQLRDSRLLQLEPRDSIECPFDVNVASCINLQYPELHEGRYWVQLKYRNQWDKRGSDVAVWTGASYSDTLWLTVTE